MFDTKTMFSVFMFSTLLACAHQAKSPAEEGVSQPADPRDPTDSATPLVPVNQSAESPAARCTSFKAPGVIRRTAVVEVIDQGLGMWLQGAKVEAQLDGKKFVGWRIKSLHLTNPCYAAVDLRPGDVVTSINGNSIARDDKAYEVFSSIKTAAAIEVAFLRGGKPQKLKFEIAAD